MTTRGAAELEAGSPRLTAGRAPGRGSRVALALAALLGTLACQRRAPGPDECHELAVRWILAERSGGYLLGSRRVVLPESLVMERTTECLTTPYDRALLQCVTAGGPPRSCLRAFEARRGAPSPAGEP